MFEYTIQCRRRNRKSIPYKVYMRDKHEYVTKSNIIKQRENERGRHFPRAESELVDPVRRVANGFRSRLRKNVPLYNILYAPTGNSMKVRGKQNDDYAMMEYIIITI